MGDTKDATALIIRNFAMLEEVYKVYQDTIGPDVFAAIDNMIMEWISDSGWSGKSSFWDEQVCQFAPFEWKRPSDNSELEISNEWIANYTWAFVKNAKIQRPDDDLNYWISPFLGIGPYQVGFCLKVEFKYLGYQTNNLWKKFLQEHNLSEKIRTFKYIQLNDGTWFIPWRLNVTALSDAYLNDTLVDALQPLDDALKNIKSAHQLLVQVLKDGQNKVDKTKEAS